MPSQHKAGAALGYVNIVVKNVVSQLCTPMLLSFVVQADYGVFQHTASELGTGRLRPVVLVKRHAFAIHEYFFATEEKSDYHISNNQFV